MIYVGAKYFSPFLLTTGKPGQSIVRKNTVDRIGLHNKTLRDIERLDKLIKLTYFYHTTHVHSETSLARATPARAYCNMPLYFPASTATAT